MNYLLQVMEFFKLDKEYSFTPMEVAIYMRLLDRCNDLDHRNPFGFSCDELRAKLKCKNADSKKAFDTARNRLKQAGLIDFANGNGRGHVTKYTLILSQKDSQKGVQKEPLSAPLSAPLSGEKRSYTKPKVNESKVVAEVPSFEEVKSYFTEITSVNGELSIEFAETFINNYQEKGWPIKIHWQEALVKHWLNKSWWKVKIQEAIEKNKKGGKRDFVPAF